MVRKGTMARQAVCSDGDRDRDEFQALYDDAGTELFELQQFLCDMVEPVADFVPLTAQNIEEVRIAWRACREGVGSFSAQQCVRVLRRVAGDTNLRAALAHLRKSAAMVSGIDVCASTGSVGPTVSMDSSPAYANASWRRAAPPKAAGRATGTDDSGACESVGLVQHDAARAFGALKEAEPEAKRVKRCDSPPNALVAVDQGTGERHSGPTAEQRREPVPGAGHDLSWVSRMTSMNGKKSADDLARRCYEAFVAIANAEHNADATKSGVMPLCAAPGEPVGLQLALPGGRNARPHVKLPPKALHKRLDQHSEARKRVCAACSLLHEMSYQSKIGHDSEVWKALHVWCRACAGVVAGEPVPMLPVEPVAPVEPVEPDAVFKGGLEKVAEQETSEVEVEEVEEVDEVEEEEGQDLGRDDPGDCDGSDSGWPLAQMEPYRTGIVLDALPVSLFFDADGVRRRCQLRGRQGAYRNGRIRPGLTRTAATGECYVVVDMNDGVVVNLAVGEAFEAVLLHQPATSDEPTIRTLVESGVQAAVDGRNDELKKQMDAVMQQQRVATQHSKRLCTILNELKGQLEQVGRS